MACPHHCPLVKNQWQIRGSGVAERQMWSEPRCFSPNLEQPFESWPKSHFGASQSVTWNGMAPCESWRFPKFESLSFFQPLVNLGKTVLDQAGYLVQLFHVVGLWFLRRKPGDGSNKSDGPPYSRWCLFYIPGYFPLKMNVWNPPKSWTFWFRLLPCSKTEVMASDSCPSFFQDVSFHLQTLAPKIRGK